MAAGAILPAPICVGLADLETVVLFVALEGTIVPFETALEGDGEGAGDSDTGDVGGGCDTRRVRHSSV